jgi:hypothetical protein
MNEFEYWTEDSVEWKEYITEKVMSLEHWNWTLSYGKS